MTETLIRGGRILDPASGRDEIADLLIRDGRLCPEAIPSGPSTRVIDARGWLVTPGFVDLHVALRDPGFQEDETTATGGAAALAGGFTSICATPDTLPVVDNRAAAEFVVLQATRARRCRVFPLGAVTRGHNGHELADLSQLVDGGAVGFTDAKTPLASAEVLRRALEYARMLGRTILTHPQDPTLTANGVMHEGYYSMLLGLRGMPAAAEEIMVGRDVALASLTGGKIHLMSLSTREGVEEVQRAKHQGLSVTADVAAHQLVLTDDSLQSYDSSLKVTPPLRDEFHRQALIAGLKSGAIDAISSDHQPSASEKKDRELDLAPFGIVGLETLLPLCIESLIAPGHLTWLQFIEKLTVGPARVLGLEFGTLQPGSLADIALIDPSCQYTIDPQQFRSRSRNTPFAGRSVTGRVEGTIVGGELRFERIPSLGGRLASVP